MAEVKNSGGDAWSRVFAHTRFSGKAYIGPTQILTNFCFFVKYTRIILDFKKIVPEYLVK